MALQYRKICSYCKIKKHPNQFSKRPDHPHLLRSWCKICTNKIKRQARRELSPKELKALKLKEALQAKLWRKNNPEWWYERNYGLGKYRYYRAKFEALRKKCKWTLTRKEYYKLISMSCYYCGGLIESKGIGLDKINPVKKEYSKQNSVPCCKRCNWIKSNWFTKEQMLKIGKVIKTFNKERRHV